MADGPERGAVADADPLLLLLDASANAVVVVDDGVVSYLNPWASLLLGYAPETLVGLPVETLLPDGLAARHRAHVTAFLADPAPRALGVGTPLTVRCQDGREVPVQIGLTPVPTAEGVRVVATLTDVTTRIAEEARSASLSRSYLTLAQLNQVIVRAPDPETLYAEACRIAVDEGGYLGAWVAVRGPESSVRKVGLAGALARFVAQVDVSLDPDGVAGMGPTAVALRDGAPVYVYDLAVNPNTSAVPWSGAAQTHGVGSMAALPVRCDGQVAAALVLYARRVGGFEGDVRDLLEQFADNISFGLDSLARARRLQEVAAHRAELLDRLVTAQEGERVRIAEDIHDDSVQALAAIDLRLGLLKGKVREAAPDLERSVDQIVSTLTTAVGGLRDLLFELEPGHLDGSLVAAVEEAATHAFDHHDLRWSLEGSHTASLSVVGRTQVLRIAKEALVNVRKHSGATEVLVEVRDLDGGVEVSVSDNGAGMDVDDLPRRPGHRGMQTMRDRAAVTGGWCRVESSPGAGTTVRVWVPAREERLSPDGVRR